MDSLRAQSLRTYTYVPNSGASSLSVINNMTETVVTTIPTANGPFETVAAPDGTAAYELDGTSTISVISTSTNTVVRTINLGLAANNNGSLAISPDGKTLYVVNNLYPNVYAVNTTTNAVTAIPVSASPTTATVSPDGTQVYVVYSAGSQISVINPVGNAVTNYTVPAVNSANSTAFSADGTRFYVADDTANGVVIINTATKQAIATVPTGAFPIGVAGNSLNNSLAYVANISGNSLSVVNTATNTLVTNVAAPGAAAVAVTPDGSMAYVTDLNGNVVYVLNLATNTIVNTIPVGAGPFLLTIGPNIIVPGIIPVMAGSEADLTALGFTQFVDFNGGTLQATGSFNTARTVSLLDNGGTIDTNDNDLTLSGSIINQGGLTKTGAGTLTLTGDNSYAGGTVINLGTLAAGSNTALGTGNVTNNGGTLTTGNGQRLINVGGTFTQNGGTLLLKIDNAGHDELVIAGATPSMFGGTLTANFAGFTSTAPLGHLGANQTLTVVTTTAGYTGQFALVPENLDPGATASLSYTPDDVLLNVNQAPGLFTVTGLNPNQQAVAATINGALRGGHDNNLISDLGNATTLAPGAFPGYLNELMPLNFHVFASSTAFNNSSFLTERMDNYLAGHRGNDGTFIAGHGQIDSSGLAYSDPGVASGLQGVYSRLLAWNPAPADVMSDSFSPLLGGIDMKDTKDMPMTAESDPRPWNLFVSGNVVLAQDFANAQSSLAHHDNTTGAMELGVDYRLDPHFLAGAFFGYGHTDGTLDDLNSTASVDTYSPGVYASYANGGWYANGLASYGFSNYTEDRNLAIGAFNGTAHGTPDGDQVLGNLDGGYDFHRGAWTFGPTAGVQYVHLDLDGYTETGAPGADLIVNRDETDSLRSRLGGRIGYAWHAGNVLLTPHLDASWQHEFMDQGRGITAQFDGLGAGSFDVRTENPSRDSVLMALGLDAQITSSVLLYGDYMVQAGQENYFGQSVEGGLKLGF